MTTNYNRGYGTAEFYKQRIERADFERGVECFGEKYGFKNRFEHEGYGEHFSIDSVNGLCMVSDIAKKHSLFNDEIMELGRRANLNETLDSALEDEGLCRVILDVIRKQALTDAGLYCAIAKAELNYADSLSAPDYD